MEDLKYKISVFKGAAIDQYEEPARPTNAEREGSNGVVSWGNDNKWPDYVKSLYDDVPTLHSIIDSCVNYICGDEMTYSATNINDNHRETLEDIIKWIALDYMLYGCFALNIIKNRLGDVTDIYYINVANIRSNKYNTEFYYADGWKSYRTKYVTYKAYDDDPENANSIFFYKNEHNSTYGSPLFSSCITACELERKIDRFHINAIDNGFTGNYLINFNNGQPTPQQQEEIEDNVYEKFTGPENAGRPILCFNNNKDSETTIQRIETEDFGEKYNTLAKRSQQSIFTAFHMSPILCGIEQDNIGFNSQEYSEAFELFNKTQIRPIQNMLERCFEKINVRLEIEEFKIDFAN